MTLASARLKTALQWLHNARIGMVSTGPGREETIFIDEFADELRSMADRQTHTKVTQGARR